MPDSLASPIGHNGGPPLEQQPPDRDYHWRLFCWRRAHKAAWKPPSRDIVLARLARAQELGMSYRDYTLEILDCGRHL